MKREVSVKKNYIYNLVYQIVTFMVPLITIPYISRIFGAEGVGIQSYTSAIASYFVLFAALGTAVYGAREIAQTRDNIHQSTIVFWEIEGIRIFSTLLCLIIWFAFILLCREYKSYYLALSIQIFAVALDITWFYEGWEQFGVIVIRNIIIKFANVAFLFICIHNREDLWLYIASIGIFTLIGNVSLWGGIRRYLTKVHIYELNLKKHLKETVIYFIPTIATSVYTVLDKTMIGILTGAEKENGYYEQAERIIAIGKTLVRTLPTVMTTRMSYLFAQNKMQEIEHRLYRTLDFELAMAIPLTLGTAGIVKKLIPWYFGMGYEKVELLLYITCPLILIVGLSGYINLLYLTPSGQRARSNKAIILGAVFNFGLNLLLIPIMHSAGAAIASVAAELLITAMYIYMSRNYISVKVLWRYSWKKMIAALVMFFGIMVTRFKDMPAVWKTTLIQIVYGGCIYIVVLIVLQDSLAKEAFDLIKQRKR